MKINKKFQTWSMESLFVWLWLVVNDRKFSAGTVFFSHTNQLAILFHELATKRISQPNRQKPISASLEKMLPAFRNIQNLFTSNSRAWQVGIFRNICQNTPVPFSMCRSPFTYLRRNHREETSLVCKFEVIIGRQSEAVTCYRMRW